MFYSWRSLLLPFMEQNAMFDELKAGCDWASSQDPYPTEIVNNFYPGATDPITAGLALPWTWSYADSTVHGKTTHPGGEYFPVLGCPSDGNAKRTEGEASPSNYAGCNGDSMIGFLWDEQGRNMEARGVIKPTRSLNGDDPAASNLQGAETSLATITDGTSNTMIVSEVVVGIADDVDLKRGLAGNGTPPLLLHGYPASNGGGIPALCLAVRVAGGEISSAYPPLPLPKAGRWLDARSFFSIYKAALPPNSPACYNGTAETVRNNEHSILDANAISASSYHTGGVNVCMGDGAVRFVSDSIDAGDSSLKLGATFFPDNDPPTANGEADGYLGGNAEGHRWMGESTYGVWGAIATPCHGESKSL
jgi:prepilin-type processing-associated H-X9-DG protein